MSKKEPCLRQVEPCSLNPVHCGTSASKSVPEPLAKRGDRLLAKIFNALLVVIASVAGFTWFGLWMESIGDDLGGHGGLVNGYRILCPPAALFCTQWYLLATTGQTLGKRWLKLKVARCDGTAVNFVRMVALRSWLASTFHLLPFVGIVGLLAIFRGNRRCLHDHLAGTHVLTVAAASQPRIEFAPAPLLASLGTSLAVFSLILSVAVSDLEGTAGFSVGEGRTPTESDSFTLPLLRANVDTKIHFPTDRSPAPTPPADIFDKVYYPAELGNNVAYITPATQTSEKRPGVIWISGGFDWGLSADFWVPSFADNDQSARAFREEGLILMIPALRGSNENPGDNQCMWGEVDDIIAAADYLATHSNVDPERIYLGGHSTGGTLALLVAASTDRFRGIFAFGPVAEHYYDGCLPNNTSETELRLRSPVHFVSDIRTPTYVIEGARSGNAGDVDELREVASPLVSFTVVAGRDHFDILAPATRAIAQTIMANEVTHSHVQPGLFERKPN